VLIRWPLLTKGGLMSDVLEAGEARETKAAQAPTRTKLVLVCSPKGGVGKTTIASNLLVRAAQQGIRALGLDLDRQRTLTKWFAKRPAEAQLFSIREATFSQWAALSREIRSNRIEQDGRLAYDLVVIDTPPSVEDHLLEVRNILEDADLTVIPTKPGDFDLESAIPWGRTVAGMGGKVVMVLNQINRQASSWQQAQNRIIKSRLSVCPVALPTSEDVTRYLDKGLALLDLTKARGDSMERFEAVYEFVAKEVGL
jgi:chromosome partitioning protein